jgi:hypothetical protein
MNAALRTFMNIWSAESNQQFSQIAINDFKDTALRFGEIGKIIEDGLSEYQKELQGLIKASENLTKGQEGVTS